MSTPQCPNCKINLVLRIAKKGKNPGSQFWGCRKWPDCMITIEATGDFRPDKDTASDLSKKQIAAPNSFMALVAQRKKDW